MRLEILKSYLYDFCGIDFVGAGLDEPPLLPVLPVPLLVLLLAPLFNVIALFPVVNVDIADDEEDSDNDGGVADDDSNVVDTEGAFFLAMISLARFDVFFSFTLRPGLRPFCWTTLVL